MARTLEAFFKNCLLHSLGLDTMAIEPFFKSATLEQKPLDRYHLALLAELQRDARQTVQQLAQAVGLSASPCWKRIKEMEAAGVIRGYTAVVDAEQLGLGLRVFVDFHMGQHSEATVRRFEQAVAAVPQIVHCHSTTGESDYSLTVLAQDIKAYEQFLQGVLLKLPGITQVRTRIALKEIKSDTRLPVQPAAPALPAKRPRRAAAVRRSPA
jgi:Lrp/AsnC family transcriptional regulator, leucine-responsive regulatory protein